MKKILFVIVLIGIGYWAWFQYFNQTDTEKLVTSRWQEYTNLLEVGLCDKAYTFLTDHSKSRHTYNDFEQTGCLARKNEVSTAVIHSIVFPEPNKANLTLDVVPNPAYSASKWTAETWFFENGVWKRDY